MAASPKKATATSSMPRSEAASALPTARGTEPATMAEAPSMPTSGAVRCMEPPLPPQHPVALP